MVEKVSNYLLDNFLYRGEKVEGDEREIMLFGITRVVEDIPKYLFVFIVGLFLHVLPQLGIVMAVTVLYKTLIGGAHARTNFECFIYTSLFFYIPVVIAKFLYVSDIYIYIAAAIIYLYSLFVIYKHAPSDTEEVPILNKEKRKKYKIYALVLITVIYVVSFVIFRYNSEIPKIVFSTVFLINFFTSKFMYKILRCKHSYESEEFKEYYNVNKG